MSGIYADPNTKFVGIGTAVPRAKLHVEGNIYASGTVTASNMSILGDFVTLNTVTSNTEQMVITNDGTGPALKVTQTGAHPIADFYDDENVLAMRIADGGNVGIGVTNPSYKLDVDGAIYASGDVIMFSDARFKTHVEPLANAIDLIADLKGVRFKWLNGTPDDRTHIGLIAQDVEKVLPEAVYTDPVTEKKSVAYPALAGAFAQALNETNLRLKILESQLADVNVRLSSAGL